jgi:hypothetical protein
LLFLIYINDFPTNISSTCFLFADDFLLMDEVITPVDTSNKLNGDLNVISDWASRWQVTMNPQKTENLIFSCKLPESVRSSPSLDCFKNNVIRHFDASTCNPLYYVGDRLPAIFHTRFRLSNSTLNYNLFLKKCVSSPSCACGYPNETTSHFFFDCNRYAAPRVKLLTSAALLLGTSWLNASRKTRLIWLLNGNISDFSFIVNKSLFTSVQRFIVESGRFACGCS